MHSLLYAGGLPMNYFIQQLRYNLKVFVSFKGDFLVSVLLVIARQIFFLLTWNFFFLQYKTIHGWQFQDLLAMYGLGSFAIGFTEFFLYGLRDIPRLIDTNELDVFLLQPKNLLLNIALSKNDPRSFSEIFFGIILLGYSGHLFSFSIVILLALAVLFAISLHLYLSSFRFFIPNGTNFVRELFQNATIITTQPSAGFKGLFKIFTMTILPTAFLTFFPIEFLRTYNPEHLLYAIVGTFIFFALAHGVFFLGLKRYESGNVFMMRK
jgi:ABC-2 type transport system permease protein